MKVTETLKTLINMSSETKTYESVNNFRRPRELYCRLYEILSETENEDRKQHVTALDDMVGMMIGNSFDDGVVTGIELAETLKEILNNTQSAYLEILSSSEYAEEVMKNVREIIHNSEQ